MQRGPLGDRAGPTHGTIAHPAGATGQKGDRPVVAYRCAAALQEHVDGLPAGLIVDLVGAVDHAAEVAFRAGLPRGARGLRSLRGKRRPVRLRGIDVLVRLGLQGVAVGVEIVALGLRVVRDRQPARGLPQPSGLGAIGVHPRERRSGLEVSVRHHGEVLRVAIRGLSALGLREQEPHLVR